VFALPALEAAIGKLFSGEPVVRADGYKVDVETLVSVPIPGGEALTTKILEIYAPALLLRVIGREVVPSARRTLADRSDVLSDFGRQIGDVMRIPGIIVIDLAGYRPSDGDPQQRKEQSRAFHGP
jgi:hypothetical protein